MAQAPKPAVFLDRDGTLNEEVNYLRRKEDLRLFPWTGPALRLLQPHFALVIITNQSGIARGLLSEEGLKEIHEHMLRLLCEEGVELQGIYYCPHHRDYGEPPYRQQCNCRKPAPGLYLRAVAELNLDLSRSWAVGDQVRDCTGAIALGCRGILLQTNPQNAQRWATEYPQIPQVPTLWEAAQRIMRESGLDIQTPIN